MERAERIWIRGWLSVVGGFGCAVEVSEADARWRDMLEPRVDRLAATVGPGAGREERIYGRAKATVKSKREETELRERL